MVVFAVLLTLLARNRVEVAATHNPTVADTVRYNRDEFGVRLHVPTGWKGTPMLLVPGPKQGIRATLLAPIDGTTYRGRFKPGTTFKYAFWLGREKFKAKTAGPILDRSGVHDTTDPDWFSQSATDYKELKVPSWPGEGAIFYALNPETFGDGSLNQRGAMSIDVNRPYIQSLSATGLWLTGDTKENGDAFELAKRTDLRIIAEGTPPKGSDGTASLAPMPASPFWRVLETESDAYPQLLSGGADGVEDHRWATTVAHFLKDPNVEPSEFWNAYTGVREDYPDVVASQLVMRFGGPTRERPSALFKADPNRLLQAWTLLFTMPGVPLFDAGDEVGVMDSGSQMQWNPNVQITTLLNNVKLLAALRLSRRSLYRGDLTLLLADDDTHVLAFLRTDRSEATAIILNNGDLDQSIRVPIGGYATSTMSTLFGTQAFTPLGGDIQLTISAHSIAIIGN